jgi:hypothetical protein
MRGYLRDGMWKTNIGMLAALALVLGLVVGGVYWARRSQGRGGGGDNANDVRLVVDGAGSKDVAVTLSDSNGTSVLRRRTTLPFHDSIPQNGGSFYQLQAQSLGKGAGTISCRVGLGRVVSTHHASGGQACVAGVGYGRDGWTST